MVRLWRMSGTSIRKGLADVIHPHPPAADGDATPGCLRPQESAALESARTRQRRAAMGRQELLAGCLNGGYHIGMSRQGRVGGEGNAAGQAEANEESLAAKCRRSI